MGEAVMGYGTNSDDSVVGGSIMSDNRTEVDFALQGEQKTSCAMCNMYEAKQFMKEEANGEFRGLTYMVPTCTHSKPYFRTKVSFMYPQFGMVAVEVKFPESIKLLEEAYERQEEICKVALEARVAQLRGDQLIKKAASLSGVPLPQQARRGLFGRRN